jgi:hypothetical protein
LKLIKSLLGGLFKINHKERNVMNREVIAVVRLALGEIGYYDDLSRTHITVTDPQRDIFAGTNCTQLRRAVKSGRIRLLSGSLGEEKTLEFSKTGNKFTGVKLAESEQQMIEYSQGISTILDVKRDFVSTPVDATSAEEFIEKNTEKILKKVSRKRK